MPHRTKKWIVTVHYTSSELGNLDVDFGVDDLEAVHLLIVNGPGYDAVRYVEIERNPALLFVEKTIEEAAGRVAPAQEPTRKEKNGQ